MASTIHLKIIFPIKINSNSRLIDLAKGAYKYGREQKKNNFLIDTFFLNL